MIVRGKISGSIESRWSGKQLEHPVRSIRVDIDAHECSEGSRMEHGGGRLAMSLIFLFHAGGG
jgi:hypothetical protein